MDLKLAEVVEPLAWCGLVCTRLYYIIEGRRLGDAVLSWLLPKTASAVLKRVSVLRPHISSVFKL